MIATLARATLGVAVLVSGPGTSLGQGAGGASALRDDPLILQRSAIGDARPLAIDLFLGRPGAAERLGRWIDSNPAASAEDRRGAWLLLCEEHHRRTLYRAAFDACRRADALRAGSAGDFLQMLGALREVPPMRWEARGIEAPLIKDSDGTRRVVVGSASGPIEAVVDTGAEFTVVMESTARRLGARALNRSAALGTTTAPIAGGLAIIDRLAIGSGHLLNVPVMVLPDAELSLPDGTSLPMILSVAALTQAGKAAFLRHGTLLALGNAVPEGRGTGAALYWDPSGIGFAADFSNGMRAVHLDTGSRRNYLYPTAMAALSHAEAATRAPFERRIAGLGGERVEQAYRFPRISLSVAGQPWVFAPMEMAPEDEAGEAARIGAPIMDRFETVILDFIRMRIYVR